MYSIFAKPKVMGYEINSVVANDDKRAITIVLVCDNHLVVMLSVLLKSIEKSHEGSKAINIFIVNAGISKENVRKINRTVSSKNILIIWKPLKEAIPKGFKLPLDNSIFPLNIYTRLFMYHFLPATVDKAIYLDVDMVVLKDIEYLWDTDLKDHVIAAVIDDIKIVSYPVHGILNYEELGMHPETRYFNSGLLIVDLGKWRKMGATDLVINTIRKNSDYVSYPDQYGLNVVFANNWHSLDPRWNVFANVSNPEPFLIHFIVVKPIFKGYFFIEEYRDIFYEIIKLTPFADYTPKGNYVWQLKRIKDLALKRSWSLISKKMLNFVRDRLTYLTS